MVHISLTWLVLVACIGTPEPKKVVQASGTEVVYTTSFPARWLVERLIPEGAQLVHIAPAGEDPTTWRPSGDLAAQMGQASLVVANGHDYESWLETVSLPQGRLLSSAAQVPPISLPGKTHSHGVDGEHSHGVTDPHTWMDPQAYLVQGQAVHKALLVIYQDKSLELSENLQLLQAELESLDRDNKVAVKDLQRVRFVANHPAYNYLFRGLRLPITTVDIDPNGPVDAGTIAEVLAWAGGDLPVVMLWESEPVADITATLPRIRHLVIDPLEQPVEGRYDYLDQARSNLNRLRALGEQLRSGGAEGVGGAEAAQPMDTPAGM